MSEPQELRFSPISSATHHTCHSRREGDWIIFTCPQCPRYVRKFNWKTRKMIVMGDDMETLHHGTHMPGGVNNASMSSN